MNIKALTVFSLSVWLFAGLPAANAAETAPKASPQNCGKTIEECQKVVDGLTAKLVAETKAYTGARQQRINARTDAEDAALQAFVIAPESK